MLRLHRRSGVLLLVLLAILVATPSLTATTVIRLDAAQLVDRAERIVRAVCTHTRSFRDERGLVMTRITLRIVESFKGSGGSTLQYIQPGGSWAGVETRIPGLTLPRVGEELVLFLGRPEPGRGVCLPVGLDQGRFQITRDEAGAPARVSRSLAGLRRIGGSTPPGPDFPSRGTLAELEEAIRRLVAESERRRR